jgi:hypothetical protein
LSIHYIPKVAYFALTLYAFISAVTHAQELSNVKDIIDKANLASYYAGDDGSAQARMVIVDENGIRQMRQFTILRKDQQDLGDQNMLVFFSRPTNVKDTVFRVHKRVQGNDDRWLFLPALDLVKRISAGDKRTSFVGSHFYYEDVSGRNPKDDHFTLVNSAGKFYTLNAQPKDKNSVEFASYQVKIDKVTFLPMETIYYNQRQQEIRKMAVLAVKNINGIATVMKSRISDPTNNSYTEMQFRNVKYDVGLPDNIFIERSMRTPPKRWLR